MVKVVERKESQARALVKFCPKFTAESNLRSYNSGCRVFNDRIREWWSEGVGVLLRAGRRVHLSAEPPKPGSLGLPPNSSDYAVQRTHLTRRPEQEGLRQVRTASTPTFHPTRRHPPPRDYTQLEKSSRPTRQTRSLRLNWVWLVLIIN